MHRLAGLLCTWGIASILMSAHALAAEPIHLNRFDADASAGCAMLREASFPELLEGPVRIVKAQLTQAQGQSSAACQVEGVISGNIGFAMRLPLSNWNGKLIELGCGGLCGSTRHVDQCAGPVHRGYACAVTDGGHQASGLETRWAFNNWQALIDYFARANYVTALAAKAITGRVYGHAPEKAYFMGCSAGGREAMMQAQRYPRVFDGIIAADPSLNQMGIRLNVAWGRLAFLRSDDGQPIFSTADLQLLHQGAVAQCDMDDGLRDGLISHPTACSFRASTLLCRGGRTPCLTAEQVAAADRLYAGPTTSAGSSIYMPGPLPGSELTWSYWFGDQAVGRIVEDAFRYYLFQPSPGETWKLRDLDFDRDPQRLMLMGGLFSATNPDLRPFKAAGGKLIVYAGWYDAAGMPLHAIDYYRTVEQTMGGRAETQSFFRLFAIPGANHCQGGGGAWSVDYLTYLEDWVERGRAPEQLIGVHLGADGRPLFTRPHYPYPFRASYMGRGDPKDASSFGPTQ